MWLMERYFTQVNEIQVFYQILLELSYISEVKKRDASVEKKIFQIFCWDLVILWDQIG